MRSGPALALVQAGAPLSGDVGIVTAVAFSPDGARLASGGSGGDIVVWDVATGAATQRLAGHGGRVSAAAFGPDGGLLITAGDDHTVRVWDAITGDELRRLTGHTGIVLDLAVTPSAADGRHPDHALVATASDDHTVRVWDPATGEELHRLTGQVTPVHAVAFTGDGRHLATGGDDGVVLIWSCATGEVTQLRRAQNVDRVTRIRSLAFDPASSRLAIGGHGFTVTLWDPFTGRETHLPTEIGYPVLSMAFAPDGTFVATASAATAIRVWDATAATVTRGKAVLGTELCAPAYHPVRATGVAVSPDGTHLATGGHDNTTRIWRIAPAVPSDSAGHRRPEHAVHLRRGATLSGHLGHVRCSAFAPDGARVATGGSDGTIRLWNPATGAELDRLIGRDAFREFFVSAGETHDIPLWMLIASPNAVAFSPDGRRLAAACGIDGILVFDLDSGAVVRRMPVASL
ncbi:MAG TPA: WD40 repeat domain-containing protein, partial [Euzebyales bacterium]|nr:WD40 repeat domain-containing protein [Euzebyales bacterium]